MSVAIHYTAINLLKERGSEVFGVQVAIADLLRAYFKYASADKIKLLIGSGDEWKEAQQLAEQAGLDSSRIEALDRRFPENNNALFSTVFRAEPDTRGMLWQRNLGGDFNFCGLAHAISGAEAGSVLQEYCLSPSRSTDAIICPSNAVRAAIRSFWDSYEIYIKEHFKADYRCPVQLPVVPLGVDVGKFSALASADKRAAQRKKLGIAEDDIAVLWVGRLSAAIKAHPLAMFQAAEKAAEKTGARVRLIMQGYFVPSEAKPQFEQLAADICRKASVSFIAADDKRFPDGLWAAGDIFLSLVDNVQESFGLTPIEAMAAGLPRVLSDWDGYRDSVADGEDGFLIRTTLPPEGCGRDLTAQVISEREMYGGFLAKVALTTAVDAEQAADRLAQLIMNKDLRASMSQKAKERAQRIYDWPRIIPAYEALWRELEAQAKAGAAKNPSYSASTPLLPDPYSMYASYPTAPLAPENRLSIAADAEGIKMLWSHKLNTYAADALAAPNDIAAILSFIEQLKSPAISELLSSLPQIAPPRLWRTLGWLLKLGIVKLS